MRKVNRILMATIAVLLSLVLITTSVVSGIFARFVISKEATVSMTLEEFNVKITITPNASLGLTPTLGEIDDNTAVISASPSLAIGDTFYDAFHIQVTGTPNTKVKFIMTCHIEYDDSENGAYTVEEGIGGLKNNTRYMPLGYTVCIPDSSGKINFDTDDYICRPYQQNKERAEIEEIIIRNTAKKLFGISYNKTSGKSDSTPCEKDDYYLDTEFAKGTPIAGKVNSFYLGFDWLETGEYNNSKFPTGDRAKDDQIVTRLSEKAAGSDITIRYTFRIEQIAEPKT